MFKNRHFEVKIANDSPLEAETTPIPVLTVDEISLIAKNITTNLVAGTVAVIAAIGVVATASTVIINALDPK